MLLFGWAIFFVVGVLMLSGVTLENRATFWGIHAGKGLLSVVATLCTIAVVGWQLAILLQPSVKLLFVKRDFSRPLIEWVVLFVVLAVSWGMISLGDAADRGEVYSATFHYRVFEVDAKKVDQLIPFAQRSAVVAPADLLTVRDKLSSGGKIPGTFGVSTHGEIFTDVQVAEISRATLQVLLDGLPVKPGVLVDQMREVQADRWRTGVADTWGYSRAGFEGPGGGGFGMGTLAYRRPDKIRIAITVRHNMDIPAGRRTVDLHSKIFYEGEIPKMGALAFVIPFYRRDDSAHYLMVVYEINVAAPATRRL